MKTSSFLVPALTCLLPLAACSRGDPRQNSNPHPQGASEPSGRAAAPAAQPAKADEKAGLDSTGRPSDASGGTGSRKTSGLRSPALPAGARLASVAPGGAVAP